MLKYFHPQNGGQILPTDTKYRTKTKKGGQILYARGAFTLRQGGRYFTPRGHLLYKNTPAAQYLCGSDFSVLFSTISTISLPAPALRRAGL